MFVDSAKIFIKAGDGGDGAVAFRREKYVASGGPDGGDGGKGGDIIFKADDSLATLADFKYKRKYRAKNGMPGLGKKKHGPDGENLVIRVPRGTLIKDGETGAILCDMSTCDEFTAAKGGKGGWGNTHFSSATRQTPRFSKPGLPGEEKRISLELKVLADVGLIGYPSVGKSSLISAVTHSRPKVADYHFTTLQPNLGVVNMGDGNSFVMADIPGLVDGAAEGAGLGHDFLRHIERCRLLVHIVDVSGYEGRDPKEDFENINSELRRFNSELATLPQIVAGNKIDLATDEQIEIFKNYVTKKGYAFFPICAPIEEGTRELINAVWQKLQTLPPIKKYEAEQIAGPAREKNSDFTITQIKPGYFVVEADWFPRVLKGLDTEDYESLSYLQRILEKYGIEDALRSKGAKEGDTVSIYDFEFEYMP